MDQFKSNFVSMLYGIRDSGLGIAVIWRLNRSNAGSSAPSDDNQTSRRPRESRANALQRISQCGLLNGGVFLLSILMFRYVILTWLFLFITLVFGQDSTLVSKVWSWLQPLLQFTFGALWVLPLFLLSRIVNALWFQDIADAAFRGRPPTLRSLSKLIADTLFSLVIQALFLLQAIMVALLPIPFVGPIISLCFMSLLYALYSFEYKWFNLGWELPRRLSFIENNWPYFLGFGLPLAVLTSLSDNFIINGCIFSILFPLFILSGNEAKPRRGSFDIHVPFFQFVVWLSNRIFHGTYFMARGGRKQ